MTYDYGVIKMVLVDEGCQLVTHSIKKFIPRAIPTRLLGESGKGKHIATIVILIPGDSRIPNLSG
jgi:hypothetical protein